MEVMRYWLQEKRRKQLSRLGTEGTQRKVRAGCDALFQFDLRGRLIGVPLVVLQLEQRRQVMSCEESSVDASARGLMHLGVHEGAQGVVHGEGGWARE